MRISIPADVFCLVTLLRRLGFDPGALKTAQIDGEKIDIWFESFHGPIKRASAKLVSGASDSRIGCPRRVYMNLRIQRSDGEWRVVTDKDYESSGLLPAWHYFGAEGISFGFDQASGETSWSDDLHFGHIFPFYRHKPGDKNRAEKEAEAAAQKMYQEWKLAAESNVSD